MSATSDSIRIAFFEKFWEAFYNDNEEATGNLKPLWDKIVAPHLAVNGATENHQDVNEALDRLLRLTAIERDNALDANAALKRCIEERDIQIAQLQQIQRERNELIAGLGAELIKREKASPVMRKLIQLTSTAVSGVDGSTTTFVYGLCDDGSAWELYAGDGVGWSPLPAIPQDDVNAEDELRDQGWKEPTGKPIVPGA